jgi:hypothetical protein
VKQQIETIGDRSFYSWVGGASDLLMPEWSDIFAYASFVFCFENRQFLLHTLTALLRAVNLRKKERKMFSFKECEFLRPRILTSLLERGFFFPKSSQTKQWGKKLKFLRSGQFFRWVFEGMTKIKIPCEILMPIFFAKLRYHVLL